MVDVDAGAISREIFVNEDIYRQEQEQVFAQAWLFVGHESQITKPGDYFVSSMGEESVILCRDREGQVNIFLNSCRHRGMKVCRYDEGNTPVFSCPYHGWSYATDGKLVGVPYFKDAYQETLDKSKWGLIKVPQMYNYKGSIWATWDKKAPPFLDYLGEMKMFLDLALDGRDGSEGGSEILGGVQKWTMPSNWKFAAENFAGDGYHNISHRSVDMVGIGPSGRGRRDNDEIGPGRRLNISFPDLGHAAVVDMHTENLPQTATYTDSPAVEEYFREQEAKRRASLGDRPNLIGMVGTVFPNMSYLARQPRSIAMWHPRGPNMTEAWRWFLIDKDTPDEVKQVLQQYYIRYSGPGGMTEQDDMENWNYAHNASKGVIARRTPYNYEMGIGQVREDTGLPGVVTERICEENPRGFYRRWATMMDAKSWDDLAPTGNARSNGNGHGKRR
ncbi:MAG: aromatic ring-hydroxylating dioxygenase subunit alpha [Chloroflexi bacterium]|nr:aromatic ring-hydroxylating dioxygenase subunit alpha [Chloroflexota bacterium]